METSEAWRLIGWLLIAIGVVLFVLCVALLVRLDRRRTTNLDLAEEEFADRDEWWYR